MVASARLAPAHGVLLELSETAKSENHWQYALPAQCFRSSEGQYHISKAVVPVFEVSVSRLSYTIDILCERAYSSPDHSWLSLFEFCQTLPTHSFLFSPLAHSLSTFFLSFPVDVLGNSFTTSTSRGTINPLIALLPFAHFMTPSPCNVFPSLTVTYAFGRSPHCSSATATTAASRISGCVTSMLSKETEEIFSPPRAC